MSTELKPCPFCGARPHLTVRPDNAEATTYFAAVGCYCGGYSACAHKMATAPEADKAEALACAAWNRRALSAQPPAPSVPGWQWVPVEPTEAMLKAGVIALNGNAVYKNVATEALRIEEQMYAEVYEAMLAAAPPPPVRERLTDREADMLQALHSLLRHAERVNEVLGHECGVRFVDTGPLDMAREAIERATGEAQR